MRNAIASFFVVVLFQLLLTSITAQGQVLLFVPPGVGVSAGYSYVQFQRANNVFYPHSGGYADADVEWRLPTMVPLQAGVGLTGSGYEERRRIYAPNGGDLYYYDPYERLYSDTGLFEIEPRIGVPLRTPIGFFAVPRVGAGLLVDSYSIDQVQTYSGTSYIDTEHHTGAAFELRPAIQAGYSIGPVAAGVEASYMYAWGDFGGLGRHAQEYRIGAFVRVGL
jgi:hypothetical protein